MSTNYRKQLEDVGGWDNELVSVPAGGVRKIIEELEATQRELRAWKIAVNECSPSEKVRYSIETRAAELAANA